MPRDWDDEDDDEYAEDWPSEEDESAVDTVPCHHCGRQVYQDAVQCCYCGIYGPTDDPDGCERRYPARPMWFWALGLLGSIAVILSILLMM